mgnify:CR=1 FL=1
MLPAADLGQSWEVMIDTAKDDAVGGRHDAASAYLIEPRSLVLLIRRGLPPGLQKVAVSEPAAGEDPAAKPAVAATEAEEAPA